MPYKDPLVGKEKAAQRWLSWAQRNPEAAANRAKEWRKNHPEQMLLISAKIRAKKLNIPFDLEISDIHIPVLCPITGLTLEINPSGNRGPQVNSPTLDKINPELGYVKGNVAVISFKANKWKSDMTKQNVETLLHYINTAPGIEGTTCQKYTTSILESLA
ncbi:MAG: hypothetical protein HGA25_09395 [Clostridiales bacterium]|nr:hypothetical protein [Clostridiales bacterium]